MSSEKSNPSARGRAALDQGAGSSGGMGQSGAEVVAKRSQPLPVSLSLPRVPGTTHLFQCKCKLLILILRGYQLATGRAGPVEGEGGEEEGEGQGWGEKVSIPMVVMVMVVMSLTLSTL